MNSLEYSEWLVALKSRYRAAQIKAAVAVNGALIEFYWSLGRDIEERFNENQYGTAFFDRLSNDLCIEIPNVKGLSPINLRYANRFYRLYRNLPQLVEELTKVPWSSHRLIIDRSGGNVDKATFYVRRTIENGWSRSQLDLQLDGCLYEKTGAAQSNLEGLLPLPDGRLARELIKSEYSFALTETVDDENEWDKPTIGLVLCRKGNRTVIEYALNTTNMPMGVGRYELTQEAPSEIQEMNKSLARLPPIVDATLSESESKDR